MNNSNSTNSSSSFEDDLIAGGILIAISISGILLHLVEMFAMGSLVRKVIGFRFFLVLSCADISLLFIFGIFPGWIILTKQPGFLTSWSRLLHTWADTCWFSMCYMNVFIALTRFACVVFPLEFRRLRRQSTCWLICAAIWLFALVQSWLMNSVPWFVVLWYDPSTYGFACDFEAYISSGTRDLYLCLNLLIVAANLVIYISTALTIFFKRNLRFQFFSTILGQNVSTKSMPSSPQEDPKMQHQVVQIQRSKAIVVIRTISVLRGSNGSNEGAASNFSVLANHSLEVRLVIPCCVNSLIFIIAQIIIINGGIGHGKWAGFSVMLIFCIQSIAPPILRFTFSEVLREEAMIMFGLKKSDKRRFRFWSVVASLISRH